jgi:hypothetical protein
MSQNASAQASEAGRAADAVDDVERNTKTQTTASSYITTDHDVIRAWAERRGGRPAAVDGTGDELEHEPDAGVLRIGSVMLTAASTRSNGSRSSIPSTTASLRSCTRRRRLTGRRAGSTSS